MHIVWQKGQGFHFPALSFIQVRFCPEHKGWLVSEGQVGQEVRPYLGNLFQTRGLNLGADTPLGGAVISASTEIPAFITTSVGVPALGVGPALAPSFRGTLLLFALWSFQWASLCVPMGATSTGFLHLALLGFILSYIWPHLIEVPPTPSGIISQVVEVNQVGQGTWRWPQVLGHSWWQHCLSWGRVQKWQWCHCHGHFSVCWQVPLSIEVSHETSKFSHDSLGLSGFIFRSCMKAGRTCSSHWSQIEGTTRAVAWNREYLRTFRLELRGLWQLFNWSLSKLLPCFCVCVGKRNVMNFFVKGDNFSLCLYCVIRTFYLRIPQNLSTPRDSWRLGGYPWAAPKRYPHFGGESNLGSFDIFIGISSLLRNSEHEDKLNITVTFLVN